MSYLDLFKTDQLQREMLLNKLVFTQKNGLGNKTKAISWVSPLFIILLNNGSKGEGVGEGD